MGEMCRRRRVAVLAVACLTLCAAGRGIAADTQLLNVGGTGAALGTMRVLGEAFARARPGVRINVMTYIGSSGAIKGVAQGTIQVGVSGRAAKESELGLPVRLVPYAVTPFVLAAHPGVPVAGLSRKQVADIYAGRQTTWPDGSPIRLILRPRRETDNDSLRSVSPEMSDALEAAFARPGMRSAATDQDAATAIARTPGALGPTTLALAVSEQRPIKALAIDDVAPSVAALESDRYRLTKRLYLVLPEKPSAAVDAFVDFVFSPAGHAILTRNAQLPIARGTTR